MGGGSHSNSNDIVASSYLVALRLISDNIFGRNGNVGHDDIGFATYLLAFN